MKKTIFLILLILNFSTSKDFEENKKSICDFISYKAIKSTIMTEDFMAYYLLANERKHKTNKDIDIYLNNKFEEMIEKRALEMYDKYGKLEKIFSVSWSEFIRNFYKFHISELAMAGEDAYTNIYYFYFLLNNKINRKYINNRVENISLFSKEFKKFDLNNIWKFINSKDKEVSELFRLIAIGNIEGASEFMNSKLMISYEKEYFDKLREDCN
ncbi:hypothetical protein FE246_08630 [Aliarcobacter thereius]|uniref:Uncharacterized protein n=1 Tax=Aliarcobacter thereius TaxID=544718 RepID=A0A5R9GXP7_9BACT|nr:hypothetical protein [Aliarcobacter thereius]TLS71021.1 hypothetical protein FE246_08630 [Aliarcobacter thereius]